LPAAISLMRRSSQCSSRLGAVVELSPACTNRSRRRPLSSAPGMCPRRATGCAFLFVVRNATPAVVSAPICLH
jgi:hypothetical protein